MKSLLLLLLPLLIFTACGEKKSASASSEAVTAQGPSKIDALTSLAQRHGYDQWSEVNEIRFTFNVDRGDNHFERSWVWYPREGKVSRIMGTDTVTYLQAEVDTTLVEVDAGFINDKYWLLAPYQWIWDRDNFTYTTESGVPAPLSGEASEKLTIVYDDEGGYTPGDAYDFYFSKDSLVSEWVFRKGNQPEPSLISTWESYGDFNGLLLSTMHQNEDGSFKLSFTDISVR